MFAAPLSLSLVTHSDPPSQQAPAGALTYQVWRGGPCIGGTLDPALRGKPDGTQAWCSIADTTDGMQSAASDGWNLEQINPGDRLAPSGAGALLVVVMSIAAEVEEEFTEWYNTEHIPWLTSIAGVICGRRFRMREAQRYVAMYHMTQRDIYAVTPSWHQADQTPWIKRLRRFQRDRLYFMYEPA